MVESTFGIVSAAAVRPPACSTLKEEFACRGRDDCQWNPSVLDTKTGKEKRKASCGPKPAARLGCLATERSRAGSSPWPYTLFYGPAPHCMK
jgi:hypothetical protein